MTEEQNQNNRRKSWDYIYEYNQIDPRGRYTGISDPIMAKCILEYLDSLPPRTTAKMFMLWARGKNLSKTEELSNERNNELSSEVVDEWWRENREDDRVLLVSFDWNNVFTAWVYGRIACPILYSTLRGWIYREPSERINRQDEGFGAFYQAMYKMFNDGQDAKEQHEGDRRIVNGIENEYSNYATLENIFLRHMYTIKDRLCSILGIPTDVYVWFAEIRRDIHEIKDDLIEVVMNSILDKLERQEGRNRKGGSFNSIVYEANQIENETIRNKILEILHTLKNKYIDVTCVSIEEEGIQKEAEAVSAGKSHDDEMQYKERQKLFKRAYLKNPKPLFAFWAKENIVMKENVTQRAIVKAFGNVYDDVSFTRLLDEGQGIIKGKRLNQDIQDKGFDEDYQ